MQMYQAAVLTLRDMTSDAMTHSKPVTSDMPNLWQCRAACRTFGSDWHLPLGAAA